MPATCLLFATLATVALSSILANADFVAPRFTVDLDLPPRNRWTHIYEGFLQRHGGWAHTGAPVFSYLNNFGTPDEWAKRNATLVKAGMYVLGEEFVQESAGLIDVANGPEINANITLGALCFFQMFYELAMQCTGILAETKMGTIHGRNLDMPLEVRNITGQITFRKNGTDIFTATQFLGYNGIHTGMRHRNTPGEGWSVQANERPTLVPGPDIGYRASGALMTVASFALGGSPVGLYLRKALTEYATFDEAMPYLETAHLASPMYVIVGGAENGKGAVITRDRKGVSRSNQFGFPIDRRFQGRNGPAWHFDPIENASNKPASAFKWRLQTNWDWWVSETESDCRDKMAAMPAWKTNLCDKVLQVAYNDSTCSDLCQLYSDGRREGGIADMQSLLAANENKADAGMIFKVMSNKTNNVLNSHTRFTSVMNSRTGYYNTVVREADALKPRANYHKSESPNNSSDAEENQQLVHLGMVMLNALLETFE